MCHDGYMIPSTEGKCGAGVYNFRVKPAQMRGRDSPKAMLQDAWARAGVGGYNTGCVIVTKPGGILINRLPETHIVPAGATTHDGSKEADRQFCSSPSVLQYYSISFEFEALVHACPPMGCPFLIS